MNPPETPERGGPHLESKGDLGTNAIVTKPYLRDQGSFFAIWICVVLIWTPISSLPWVWMAPMTVVLMVVLAAFLSIENEIVLTRHGLSVCRRFAVTAQFHLFQRTEGILLSSLQSATVGGRLPWAATLVLRHTDGRSTHVKFGTRADMVEVAHWISLHIERAKLDGETAIHIPIAIQELAKRAVEH